MVKGQFSGLRLPLGLVQHANDLLFENPRSLQFLHPAIQAGL